MRNTTDTIEASPADGTAVSSSVDAEAASTTPQFNGDTEDADNESAAGPTANIITSTTTTTTTTPSFTHDCNSDYIQQLLQIARDAESPSDISEEHSRILCEAVDFFWQCSVLRAPETYVPTDREFALFNYFRSPKYKDNAVAQRLVARYWDSKSDMTEEVGNGHGDIDTET